MCLQRQNAYFCNLRPVHLVVVLTTALFLFVVTQSVYAQDTGSTPVEVVGTVSPPINDSVLELNNSGVSIEPVVLTGDFTIEARVNFTDGEAISNTDILVGSELNNVNFHRGQVRIWDGSITTRRLRDQVVANHVIAPGEWTHFAIVREAGETKIYVDFALNATSTRTWTNNFTIDEFGRGFNGMIDDLKIWNNALSQSELLLGARVLEEDSALANNETATQAVPLRHYSFDNSQPVAINESPIEIGPHALTGNFTIQASVLFDEGKAINNVDGIVASATNDLNFHRGLLRLHARGSGDLVIANTPARPNIETHYTIVRRNGNLLLLVDGVLDARSSTRWTEDFIITHAGTGIAGLNSGSGLSGELSGLTFFDYALSQAEVDELLSNIDNGVASIVDQTGNSAPIPLPAGATIVSQSTGTTSPPETDDPTSIIRSLSSSGNGINIDDVSITGNFTMSAWVLFDPAHTASTADELMTGPGVRANFNGGSLNFDIDGEGSIVRATVTAQAGVWTHYAITREDDGHVRLYINGILDNSSAVAAGNRTQATPWRDDFIIAEVAGLTGVIDGLQIWNVARSQVEIQEDLQGLSTIESAGLVSLYSFDGNSNLLIDDAQHSASLPLPAGSSFSGAFAPFEVISADSLSDVQIASDMVLPLDLAFLPDGRMIVVEKGGLVYLYEDPTAIGSDRGIYIDVSSITNNEAERGLLAVEVDPEFETNGYVYLYHTVLNPNNTLQKSVARYTHVEAGGGSQSTLDQFSRTIIWREQAVTLANAASVHHGGGLAIGYEPINSSDPSPYKLYIVTSDESIPRSSADLGSDNGKVHRVNLSDGSIPTDNPYYNATAAAAYRPFDDVTSSLSSAGILTTIHSHGVRNGWRASYDQESNSLFFGEVGSNRFEDMHLAVTGADYGWPDQEGFLRDSNAPGNPIFNYPSRGGPGRDGLNDTPETANGSITGGVVYRGSNLPAEFQEAYFYGDWGRNWIRYAKLNFSGNRPTVTEDVFFSNTTGRVLSFEEGPDGGLYYITTFQTADVFSFQGAVNRISFDDSNSAPGGRGIVVLPQQLSSSTAPHTVNFAAHAVDAEGDALTYRWRFGDGSTSTAANPTHTFTSTGDFVAELTVTDAAGSATEYQSITITVGNAPEITITSPVDGDTYRAGETITVEGFAIDAEDGVISGTSLVWSSSYFTGELSRPGPFEAIEDGSGAIVFNTPEFGNVEFFLTSLAIVATATDSDGLTRSKSVSLSAETRTISFDVPNDEVQLIVVGFLNPLGDYSMEAVIDFVFDLEAQASYIENGVQFFFSHWADEPQNTNRFRRIATPATNFTFRPVYLP